LELEKAKIKKKAFIRQKIKNHENEAFGGFNLRG
jgi:hypothetical protein